jgi:hypothetical protein
MKENYSSLKLVLDRAFQQAAYGKGEDRHSTGQPFDEQPIVSLQFIFGTGYAFGQAAKKMEESQRLNVDMASKELLGAINYIAAALIYIEKKEAIEKARGDNHETP